MGSSDSRFADRAQLIDDLNAVHVNFLGGSGFEDIETTASIPCDKLVLAHCNETDPSVYYPVLPRSLKAPQNGEMAYVKIYSQIMESLKQRKAKLSRHFERSLDPKKAIAGQRFPKKEAFRQLDSAQFNLEYCFNYTVMRPVTPKKGFIGPEMKKISDSEMLVSGWENFPLLALKTAIEHPYIFDTLKHDVLKWEFGQD
jgi:hypothetical protein